MKHIESEEVEKKLLDDDYTEKDFKDLVSFKQLVTKIKNDAESKLMPIAKKAT